MFSSGTLVTQVTASDADDPSSGNNARLVYSLLQGQPYFSIEPTTGIPGWNNCAIQHDSKLANIRAKIPLPTNVL